MAQKTQAGALYQSRGGGMGWEMGRRLKREGLWQPTPVFLPGKFHGLRSLVGYSPWGCKESDTTEQLHFTSYVYPWLIHVEVWQKTTKFIRQLSFIKNFFKQVSEAEVNVAYSYRFQGVSIFIWFSLNIIVGIMSWL